MDKVTSEPVASGGDFNEQELETLIRRWQEQGEVEAGNQLMALMYSWLKRQANILLTKRYGRSHDGEHRPLITTTELTHNLIVKLMDMQNRLKWQGRGKFLSFVLTVMRNYLMDLAKSAYHRTKRPMEDQPGEMPGETAAVLEFGSGNMKTLLPASDIDKMSAITEIFRNYEKMDPLRGQIVQLNIFCGAAPQEIVRFFGEEHVLTVAEVEAHLRIAKVYLKREMAKAGIHAG
jgi:hypothetical protein